ncbi:MAG: M20/M25/M40 family metallo-hydrolase [Gemmatimonadales bacterium]|nr:M20/M25/M40 family metallo-hydrolase [Gemmatimonadales bacterium]
MTVRMLVILATLALAVGLWAPGALAAQAADPPGLAASAASTITPSDVARRIGILAHDSMLGRDTPSRGLELTARYVADQFRRFGLRPGGENGAWLQRYPITRRRLHLAGSQVVLRVGGVSATAPFDRAARFVSGDVPLAAVGGPVVLVGGAVTPEAVASMKLRDKVVLYVHDYSWPIPPNATQVARAIRLSQPKAIVALSNLDAAAFAARIPSAAPDRYGMDLRLNAPPSVEVSEAAVAAVLRTAKVNLAEVRKAPGAVARELPGMTAELTLKETVVDSLSAPNTIGIVEGSDPELRGEYLVFSAHMDHIGVTPSPFDSINNGADDNASGTAGVVELAEAFSRPGGRSRRSVIFLTVSGEEKGLWGSRYFSEHPTVPLEQIVADINLDMLGRNWADTIVAIGKEHSDLGATLERVNAAHPELRMVAIDDRWPEERFYFRSDHYNFARKGVPALFFFNGVHPDYHRVTDSAEKIDSEKESRILKLLYYLGREIGSAPRRPAWNAESRAEIVE